METLVMQISKLVSLFFLVFVLLNLFHCIPDIKEFRTPAEWEKQESVWLAWPVFDSIKGRHASDVTESIVRELASFIKVDLIVQDENEKTKIISNFNTKKIPFSHVRFHIAPHEDIWMRDMGPIFQVNGKKERRIVDFNFNLWGYQKENSFDETVDRVIANNLGLPTIKANLFSEGGGVELNGNGIALLTEAVSFQRNPNLTKEQIEAEYKRVLNIKKIIWIKEGLPEDQHSTLGTLPGRYFTPITTGGHVDEFVRFVSTDTILLGEISEEEANTNPILKLGRTVLENAYKTLAKETDLEGKPFKIIRLPMPELLFETIGPGDGTYDFLKDLEFKDGTKIIAGEKIKIVLAASYMNYLITNGAVLIPKYWKEGRSEQIQKKDQAAVRILSQLFPDRKIIQINPENVNIGGGGIHCITQQMPAVE